MTDIPAARRRPAILTDEIRLALEAISWDMPGMAVERESFRRIESECADTMHSLPPETWLVARRLIHTTADTTLASRLVFRHDAVAAGVAALRAGAKIICDSRMIRAGLSLPRLSRCNPLYTEDRLISHIADPDVAAAAKATGRTRALCAVEKAWSLDEVNGSVFLIGNAPLALARLARYVLEDGARPALVVGMPVGFVNVSESKELLALCEVPQIVLQGRRGGSPLAVATVHALLEVALAGGQA